MKKTHKRSSDLELILESLASSTRLNMLKSLAYQKLSYSELAKAVGMDRDKDAGKFSYHLRKLLECGLIEVDSSSGKYTLSQKGVTVFKHLEKLEEEVGGRTLMIVRRSDQIIEPFDKNKIAEALIKEAKLSPKLAKEVASITEKKLLDLKIDYLTAPLIRELVNSILLDMGLEKYRHKLTRIGMPLHDAETLFKRAVSQGDWKLFLEEASGSIIKEYLLLNFLPRKIAEMHLHGGIDIHPINGWLTNIFSRMISLDSQNLVESAIDLIASTIYTKYEVMLCGEAPALKRLLENIPHNLSSRTLLSLQLNEELLPLIENIDARLGILLNILQHNPQELIKLSRRLNRLGIPHSFSISDEVCFSGFKLNNDLQAIHSIISFNVLELVMLCGGDLERIITRLKERVKAVIPILKKGLEIISKFHPRIRACSIISLSGIVEASKLLARDKSSVIEEAIEIELAIIKEVSKIISQDGGGRILLGGRCPKLAARRFLQIDSYRYGEENLKNVIKGGSRIYSVTPIPDLEDFKSIDSWIDSIKEIVRFLDGGFYISLKANRFSKGLSDAIHLAENLNKLNRYGVISISVGS